MITSEQYNDLQAQRVLFNDFVRSQDQSVLRVIEVTVRNESLSTLAYRYYGNLDNYDLLKNLNNFDNPSLLNGVAKIVTAS